MNHAFPVRLLNKSLFLVSDIPDPAAAARLGWRAPVFVYMPKEPVRAVEGSEYTVPVVDVTGLIVGERKVAYSKAFDGLDGYCPLGDSLREVRQLLGGRCREDKQKLAFFAVCQHMDAQTSGSDTSWQEFLQLLEKDRFEPGVWFERDRANVGLTDRVTGDEIFSLWDEDVGQAVEDGFLEVPGGPRPTEQDWLPSLVAYAQEHCDVPSLRSTNLQKRAERPRFRP